MPEYGRNYNEYGLQNSFSTLTFLLTLLCSIMQKEIDRMKPSRIIEKGKSSEWNAHGFTMILLKP